MPPVDKPRVPPVEVFSNIRTDESVTATVYQSRLDCQRTGAGSSRDTRAIGVRIPWIAASVSGLPLPCTRARLVNNPASVSISSGRG